LSSLLSRLYERAESPFTMPPKGVDLLRTKQPAAPRGLRGEGELTASREHLHGPERDTQSPSTVRHLEKNRQLAGRARAP